MPKATKAEILVDRHVMGLDVMVRHAAAVLAEHPRPMATADVAAEMGVDESVALDVLLQGFMERRFDRRTLTVGVSTAQTSWTVRPTSAPIATAAAPEPTPAADPPPRGGLVQLFRRGRPAAPTPPASLRPDPAALLEELRQASEEADTATQALAAALERRHKALIRVSALFPAGATGKAAVNRLILPFTAWRACAFFGLDRWLDLPHQMQAHRSSFRDMVIAIPAPPAAPTQKETSHADVG